MSSERQAELAAFGAAIEGKRREALRGHRAYWTSVRHRRCCDATMRRRQLMDLEVEHSDGWAC